MEAHVKLDIKPSEIEAVEIDRNLDTTRGRVITTNNLVALFDEMCADLTSEEALEIWVYRKYILVGMRRKGHGDRMRFKFTNFGFQIGSSKSDKLSEAIRVVDEEGTLPEYVYRAMDGDMNALRETTSHYVRVLSAKIERMKQKGKAKKLIRAIQLKKAAAENRLSLSDDEFALISEPIIVEIPMNSEIFHSENDTVL